GSVANGKKFFVGNKLLLRNAYRNNTVYKVQAFNALGFATASTQLVLKKSGKRKEYRSQDSLRNDAATSIVNKKIIVFLYLLFFKC
uniref:Uncharacterized protein n=1 Tax=Ciona savignyi TaxID=51511 RepID=H2Y3Y1_CIOSA